MSALSAISDNRCCCLIIIKMTDLIYICSLPVGRSAHLPLANRQTTNTLLNIKIQLPQKIKAEIAPTVKRFKGTHPMRKSAAGDIATGRIYCYFDSKTTQR